MRQLTHLTIDSSIRSQLPSISDDTWITTFQSGVLYFHVTIFVEFCIVHYAYRQKKKLKKMKRREQGALPSAALPADRPLHRAACATT
jgi:hypothetical protein